jgi:hypothetical protein
MFACEKCGKEFSVTEGHVNPSGYLGNIGALMRDRKCPWGAL